MQMYGFILKWICVFFFWERINIRVPLEFYSSEFVKFGGSIFGIKT